MRWLNSAAQAFKLSTEELTQRPDGAFGRIRERQVARLRQYVGVTTEALERSLAAHLKGIADSSPGLAFCTRPAHEVRDDVVKDLPKPPCRSKRREDCAVVDLVLAGSRGRAFCQAVAKQLGIGPEHQK